MEYLEAIVRMTESLSTCENEKDRRFIKTTINNLKSYLDKVDKISDIDDRVQKLETQISFIKREGQ